MITASEMGKIGGAVKSERKRAAAAVNGAAGGRPVSAPVVNDDGVSIKGCSYIYSPKGQALEYSALASNPYSGCGHKCAYCYVPKALRMKDRKAFDSSAIERSGYRAGMIRECKKYSLAGITEQVMLSFTTDPYHPFDTSATRFALELLSQETELGFCTLSKGGTRALRDLSLFRREKDAFATTMTSLDDAFSLKWERGAALPGDRIEAIKRFHESGIFTWVSLEPTLDVEASMQIVRETHQFVDLFKVGRVNYLPMTKTTDWEDYTLRMIDLCNSLGVDHYIKKDLQPYLPEGYSNPLRVRQHHD